MPDNSSEWNLKIVSLLFRYLVTLERWRYKNGMTGNCHNDSIWFVWCWSAIITILNADAKEDLLRCVRESVARACSGWAGLGGCWVGLKLIAVCHSRKINFSIHIFFIYFFFHLVFEVFAIRTYFFSQNKIENIQPNLWRVKKRNNNNFDGWKFFKQWWLLASELPISVVQLKN